MSNQYFRRLLALSTLSVLLSLICSNVVSETLSPSSVNIEMVSLPGGTFTMGSPATEVGRGTDETQHSVTVGAFRIGKYEVTQGQWKAVMGSNPSYFSSCGDNCPVEMVSWLGIQNYIAALNAQTGQHYRLPTEAEWEYACRAGSTNPYLTYCGSNDVNAVAWYDEQRLIRHGDPDLVKAANVWHDRIDTHPVGGKAANAFGLYDMSGNVYEWTCSDYADPWNGSELSCNTDANNGASRSGRGGSWRDLAYSVHSASRFSFPPAHRGGYLGFRLAHD